MSSGDASGSLGEGARGPGEKEAEASCSAAVSALFLPVYLPSVLRGMADGVALPAVPLFARALGLGDAQIGACSAAIPAGQFMGDIPSGLMAAKIGMKRSMALGMLCYGLAAALAALSTSFLPLFLALMLSGVSESLYGVARQAYMRNNVSDALRGRTTSILGGINRMTRALGPLCGGFVAHHFGVATPLLLRGMLSVIGAGMILVFMPKEKTVAATHKGGHSFKDMVHTIKLYWRVYMTAGLVTFLLSFIRRSRNFLLPVQADDLQLSHRSIGLVVAAGYAVDSLLFAPVGYCVDHYGRKATGVPAMVILSGGLFLLGLSTGMTTIMVASVVMGLGNGLSAGLVMILGGDLAPKGEDAGHFLGLWNLLMDAGATAGPVVTGSLAEHGGLGLSGACFVACAVGAVGSAWFFLTVPETLKEKRQAKKISSVRRGQAAAEEEEGLMAEPALESLPTAVSPTPAQ